MPPAAACWVCDVHLVLADIIPVNYEETLVGNLDGAGVIHIHRYSWSCSPLCRPFLKEVTRSCIVACTSSDEIGANVLHTDGCVVTSFLRQLADHAVRPSLLGHNKAGCSVASNIATTGDKLGACTCGCKGRMCRSCFRKSWRGAAADSRVDFRAGEATGVEASCHQKNSVFAGSLGGRP